MLHSLNTMVGAFKLICFFLVVHVEIISTAAGSDKIQTNAIKDVAKKIEERLRYLRNPHPFVEPARTGNVLTFPMRTVFLQGPLWGNLTNITLEGLSTFSTPTVKFYPEEAYTTTKTKKISITGDFTHNASSKKLLKIIVSNVIVESTFPLTMARGRVESGKPITSMAYDDLAVTPLSGINQTALNAIARVIYTTLKPYIYLRIDERSTEEMKKSLKKQSKYKKSSSVTRTEVDLAILEARRYVGQDYEPFEIPHTSVRTIGSITLKVNRVQIKGLSNFARKGALSTKMIGKIMQVGITLKTNKLSGLCDYEYSDKTAKIETTGTASLSIDNIQFDGKINLNPTLNSHKQPVLEVLKVQLGKITVNLIGKGKKNLNESLSEGLTEILDYYMFHVVDKPVKEKIQGDVLDKLSVK